MPCLICITPMHLANSDRSRRVARVSSANASTFCPSTASVTLPPARVLSTRLDNDRSWVYARTTDILAQRHEDLETRARQEAERTLEQAALDGGILERARVNAERTVATFVRSLGYAAVTVTSRTP